MKFLIEEEGINRLVSVKAQLRLVRDCLVEGRREVALSPDDLAAFLDAHVQTIHSVLQCIDDKPVQADPSPATAPKQSPRAAKRERLATSLGR